MLSITNDSSCLSFLCQALCSHHNLILNDALHAVRFKYIFRYMYFKLNTYMNKCGQHLFRFLSLSLSLSVLLWQPYTNNNNKLQTDTFSLYKCVYEIASLCIPYIFRGVRHIHTIILYYTVFWINKRKATTLQQWQSKLHQCLCISVCGNNFELRSFVSTLAGLPLLSSFPLPNFVVWYFSASFDTSHPSNLF